MKNDDIHKQEFYFSLIFVKLMMARTYHQLTYRCDLYIFFEISFHSKLKLRINLLYLRRKAQMSLFQ